MRRYGFRTGKRSPCYQQDSGYGKQSLYHNYKLMVLKKAVGPRNYFFRVRIYSTISLTSASFNAGWGVIGTAPHTPEPPEIIFFTSLLMVVSAALLYFSATLL